MFKILNKTLRAGIVTASYPDGPPRVSDHFRGRPVMDFQAWKDPRPAAAVCPTGAISVADATRMRRVTVDYGKCIFCGLCAEETPEAIRMTPEFELAVRSRADLVTLADYELIAGGKHGALKTLSGASDVASVEADSLVDRVSRKIRRVLGRSLSIREVDAGSCNGCELEIIALNSPVYDLERLGAHFVASPRHADMLLVTGPVTRNMELALLKTFAATPAPKVVVAVGACGISGGIFGCNYASRGSVDSVLPVDVYIPGCPPRPQALLHGILLAIGRIEQKLKGSKQCINVQSAASEDGAQA